MAPSCSKIDRFLGGAQNCMETPLILHLPLWKPVICGWTAWMGHLGSRAEVWLGRNAGASAVACQLTNMVCTGYTLVNTGDSK